MLFNVSPYGTRWMLWHHFVNGLNIEGLVNERMDIGKRLQPAILDMVEDALRLEVRANREDTYVWHPDLPLGCTVDADTVDQERGLGVVEAKNVDWQVWRDTWTPKAAPQHIELQMQTQMMVRACRWGIIAALVGGNDLVLYERVPMVAVQQMIAAEVRAFWHSVAAREEPDALGAPMELSCLAALYPTVDPTVVLDCSTDTELGEVCAQYDHAKKHASFWDRASEGLKAKILARSGLASGLRVPGGMMRISRSVTAASVVTPDMVGKVVRKESIRTTLKFTPIAEHAAAPTRASTPFDAG